MLIFALGLISHYPPPPPPLLTPSTPGTHMGLWRVKAKTPCSCDRSFPHSLISLASSITALEKLSLRDRKGKTAPGAGWIYGRARNSRFNREYDFYYYYTHTHSLTHIHAKNPRRIWSSRCRNIFSLSIKDDVKKGLFSDLEPNALDIDTLIDMQLIREEIFLGGDVTHTPLFALSQRKKMEKSHQKSLFSTKSPILD